MNGAIVMEYHTEKRNNLLIGLEVILMVISLIMNGANYGNHLFIGEVHHDNTIDALTEKEFTNWLLDNDYDLGERDINQWWHLWYKFLVYGGE